MYHLIGLIALKEELIRRVHFRTLLKLNYMAFQPLE